MPIVPRGHRLSALDHEPEAVLYARNKAQLSQAQAAHALGISAGYLSEIEKGTRNAGPALLEKMAGAYNCPVVVLERKRYADEDVRAALGEIAAEDKHGAA